MENPLWTLTANLDFDGSDMVYGKVEASGYYQSALIEARSNFVRWVEGVIASHQNSNLQVFRIFTDLGPEHTQTIDKWLTYALANKVRTLELNLYDSIGSRNVNNHHYDFPYKRGNLPANFKILKQLTLDSGNVAGETLEYFVSICPLLEGLSLTHCPVLTSLEINRPSPSFKCLDIRLCHTLKSLVVRDSDLVTLKYGGMPETAILLHNVPFLTHLWLSGLVINSNLDDVARMFAPVLQQIQFLNLYFAGRSCYPTQLPRNVDCAESSVDADAAVAAAVAARALNRRMMDVRFDRLMEVEFAGYRGAIAHLEFIKLLVGNAAALRSTIIDPSAFDVLAWRRIPVHGFFDDEMLVRARAEEQLRHIVPHNVALRILSIFLGFFLMVLL